MKPLIWLTSLAAIGLALAIAMAGPGTRFGWWQYSTGLKIIQDAAIPVLLATGACFVATIVAMMGARALVPVTLSAMIVAGLAGAVPLRMKQLVDANPFIHDITTDFEDPPPILAGAELDRNNPPAYVGNEKVRGSHLTVAEAQTLAFPDLKTMKR